MYHALLEDLASHGWVVAAIDPPYDARAVRFRMAESSVLDDDIEVHELAPMGD